MRKQPTQERLCELFEYRDGALWWRQKINPACRMDRPAGSTTSTGYLRVQVDGRQQLQHRVVWIMHNGPIPDHLEIDHIDRDETNNRIENLRLVTPSQNIQNKKRTPLGIYIKPDQPYRPNVAYIGIGRKKIYLGSFREKWEALLVRECAEIIFHPYRNKSHGVTA